MKQKTEFKYKDGLNQRLHIGNYIIFVANNSPHFRVGKITAFFRGWSRSCRTLTRRVHKLRVKGVSLATKALMHRSLDIENATQVIRVHKDLIPEEYVNMIENQPIPVVVRGGKTNAEKINEIIFDALFGICYD